MFIGPHGGHGNIITMIIDSETIHSSTDLFHTIPRQTHPRLGGHLVSWRWGRLREVGTDVWAPVLRARKRKLWSWLSTYKVPLSTGECLDLAILNFDTLSDDILVKIPDNQQSRWICCGPKSSQWPSLVPSLSWSASFPCWWRKR